MTTPQIEFWRGTFGDEYVARNTASAAQLAARISLWCDILKPLVGKHPKSILEVGCNLGINLRALRAISGAEFYAVEPNDKARTILLQDGVLKADNLRGGFAQNIDFPDDTAEMAFTSGVLIHIHPDDLLPAMTEIYRCASRFVACVEYFSDKPEMITYRGHQDRLFKRDFGGYWLDNFPGLTVLGTGFAWKRTTGLDNLNWWLFEKSR
jgi:pseudaminic acid biosynthesis-associated methylase